MTFDLKGMQDCQLEILLEFKRVCEKNDLKFFLAYGTCIGAVRHNGFIPWDDDIDVCMPADDFEKLKKCSSDFSNKFFLQTNQTDSEYGLMIARLRNNETTLIEEGEDDRDMNHGVFIDIYPLFNASKNKIVFYRQVFNSLLYRLLVYGKPAKNRGKVMKICSSFLLKLLPKKMYHKICDHAYGIVGGCKSSGLVSSFYGNHVTVTYDSDWLFPTKEIEFEGIQMPVPGNADKYLTFSYGNYMKLPPEEKRVVHHNFKLLDLNNGYLNYKGTYYCKK